MRVVLLLEVALPTMKRSDPYTGSLLIMRDFEGVWYSQGVLG